MKFSLENRELRDFFEMEADFISRMPLVGMLYSCGFHNFALIGCVVYLLAKRKRREILVLVPSLLTVLVCLASPVNAYIRYMLPVMAALPLNIVWCYYVAANEKGK